MFQWQWYLFASGDFYKSWAGLLHVGFDTKLPALVYFWGVLFVAPASYYRNLGFDSLREISFNRMKILWFLLETNAKHCAVGLPQNKPLPFPCTPRSVYLPPSFVYSWEGVTDRQRNKRTEYTAGIFGLCLWTDRLTSKNKHLAGHDVFGYSNNSVPAECPFWLMYCLFNDVCQ